MANEYNKDRRPASEFPWQLAEFCQLLPANAYRSNDISRYYRTPGLGVPLVAPRVAELTRILRQHACDAE
jgi:hypothetical protein